MANYMLLNVHGISTKYLLMLPHNARLFRWGIEEYVLSQNYSKPKVLGYRGHIWLARAAKDEKELQCLFGQPTSKEPIGMNNTFGWQWHEGSFYPSELLNSFLDWIENRWSCIKNAPKEVEEWVLPSWIARNESVRQHWGAGGGIAIHWNRGERNEDCIAVQKILKERYGNSTTLPMNDADVFALCRASTKMETLVKAYDKPAYGCKRVGGHISEPALHLVEEEILGNASYRKEVLRDKFREYLEYANSTERLETLLSTQYRDVHLIQARPCKCTMSRKSGCSKSERE